MLLDIYEYMKKLFLIFIFLFTLTKSFGQTSFYFNQKQYESWQVSNQAQCGLGSIFCTVYRSQTVNEYGNYIYYVYFASNSYFYNCQFARTYVPNINVYYLDNKTNKYLLPLNYYPFWITVGPTSLVYTLYHPDPYLRLWINVGIMEPTNY